MSEEVIVFGRLIDEGNKKLKIALEKGNLTEAKGAHNLIAV